MLNRYNLQRVANNQVPVTHNALATVSQKPHTATQCRQMRKAKRGRASSVQCVTRQERHCTAALPHYYLWTAGQSYCSDEAPALAYQALLRAAPFASDAGLAAHLAIIAAAESANEKTPCERSWES